MATTQETQQVQEPLDAVILRELLKLPGTKLANVQLAIAMADALFAVQKAQQQATDKRETA